MPIAYTRHLLDHHRFLRFCIIGAAGFAVDYGILSALIAVAGADVFLARIASIALAILVTWLLNRRYTFRSNKRRSLKEAVVYAFCTGLAAVVNYAVYSAAMLWLIWEPLTLRAFFALVAGTGAGLLINYNSLRLIVFRSAADDR